MKFKELGKKGVFGLSSVQQFFTVVLGLVLLAYVIVVIMASLQGSSLIPVSSLSATVINESGGFINATGYTLATASILGFANPSIITIINATGLVIQSANYTLSTAGVLRNATATNWNSVNITYSYNYNTVQANNANQVLSNTSAGITSFFSSINPVYAILAILVIILVLIVLVRVVSGKEGNMGSRQSELQL